jgi:hypothetical protein
LPELQLSAKLGASGIGISPLASKLVKLVFLKIEFQKENLLFSKISIESDQFLENHAKH